MDCPIHLEKIPLEKGVAALPCGHVFCMPCITKCINAVKPKPCPCPICKQPATHKKILRLFLQASSPTTSPTKSRAPGHLSAAEFSTTQALHHALEDLNANSSSKEVQEVSIDMQHAADSIGKTSMDIEAKCLAEEIKSAATRFQDLILPALQELESVRLRISDIEAEMAGLKAALHQTEKEKEANCRKKMGLEKDLANFQMSKRLADNKLSSVRERLSVTSEKLVDAQNDIRTRDETIGKHEESLAQYRKWLADHKSKGEKYKLKINELEALLSQRPSHIREEPLAGSSRATWDSLDVGDNDRANDTRPSPAKRRRTDHEDVQDVKLDMSCFVTRPKSSFQLPATKAPQRRADARNSALPGLNLTKGGQFKGLVALGSRQRLGKMG